MLSSILRAWRLEHEQAHWSAGAVHGNVDFSTRTGLAIHVDAGPKIVIKPGAITYRPVGESPKSITPAGNRALIQEPYLVLPRLLETEVGLRLVSQILVEPNAVTMDFRMETVAPLDDLAMELALEVKAGTLRPKPSAWSRGSTHLTRRELHALDLVANDAPCAFLTDLGEGGHGELIDGKAKITFFEQPLEKGVILIGRWGLLRRLPEETQDQFDSRQKQWLERRTFL